jgi:hypothetical protein
VDERVPRNLALREQHVERYHSLTDEDVRRAVLQGWTEATIGLSEKALPDNIFAT